MVVVVLAGGGGGAGLTRWLSVSVSPEKCASPS